MPENSGCLRASSIVFQPICGIFSAGSDGAIYLAWRQVYAGNIRDITFTSSRDGGRTFAPPATFSGRPSG